jgi:hypothetical protein
VSLPPLYAGWLHEVVASLPEEREATCDRCAMCGTEERGVATFNPSTKCCTYLPIIPNFLAGEILLDDDPAAERGRASVRRRIDARVAVTPLGLGRSPAYQLLYDSGEDTFGRATSLRCPHYLDEAGGKCGIWKHRNSTCATWFCKHERGATGLRFWRSVDRLLHTVEEALVRWCIAEADLDSATLERLFPPPLFGQKARPTAGDLDGQGDRKLHEELWGEWSGREAELYIRCARQVASLTWREVLKIAGPTAQVAVRLLREAQRDVTSRGLPRRMRVGSLRIVDTNAACTRVQTYSPFDPQTLPSPLLSALGRFDGRATDEVLLEIGERDGLDVTGALLERLVDFRILVEEDGEP